MSNTIDSFIVNGTEREIDNIIFNDVEYLLVGSGGGTRYTITWNLTNITPNPNRASVEENRSLQVTLTPASGYEIETESVTVLMGGVDITSTAYSNGAINISSVAANISVTAMAKVTEGNLFNVTWANHAITCGQDTYNYNGWSPHNLQYDDVNDCFVFLQCHADDHVGGAAYANWTLSLINPYDSTDVTPITIPSLEGLGNLVVDNGDWYLLPRNESYAYKSTDKGATWETLQASIPQYLFGVYKCGDTYFGGDDKNSGRKYYVSSDLLTWTEKEFDSSFGTTLCETSFCEYNGAIWAFNRTNDSTLGHPIILKSVDNGETWTLFSNSLLHGYRSTVSCCKFADCIVIADIDRDNGVLYYNKFNGTTVTLLNSWEVPCAGDDFHNVNVATNYKDAIILEFMHATILPRPSSEYVTNYTCDNVMLVGSTKTLPSVNYTFVNTQELVMDFLNNECTYTHGGNYEITFVSGSGIRIIYDSSNGSFIDELSFPLNSCCRSTHYCNQYYLNGDEFVKPINNPLSPTLGQNFSRPASALKLSAILTIKGHRYMTSYIEGKLPVITRCDNLYELTPYSVDSGYNQIYGQTWQANLPFRKVFPIQQSSTEGSYLGLFDTTFVGNLDTYPIIKVNYTAVT